MTVDEKQLRLTLITFSKVRAVMNSIRPCWKCWTAMRLCLGGRNATGKPVRVWSLKIGAAIEHAVAAVKDEVRAVGPVRRWRIGLHNRYEDHFTIYEQAPQLSSDLILHCADLVLNGGAYLQAPNADWFTVAFLPPKHKSIAVQQFQQGRIEFITARTLEKVIKRLAQLLLIYSHEFSA